jgi:hypothetical protein
MILMAGCAHIGSNKATQSPSQSPTDVPTAVSPATEAAPTPTSVAPATTSPTPTTRLTPSPSAPPLPPPSFVAGLAASDRFWDYWVDTDCFFGLDPLMGSYREMARKSDLIIRGRIVDVYIGEYWTMIEGEASYPLAYAKVAVDELLKGEPVSREEGFVEVQIGHAPEDMADVRSNIPMDDHLWFLDFEDREDRGPGNNDVEIAGYVYYAGQDVEEIFRSIGGVVELLRPGRIRAVYGRDAFLLTLQGMNFEEFVERVSDEIGQSSRGTTISARILKDRSVPADRWAAC